ncbi:MAG: class I SAM-dependent methyltransferase [Planctomycetaceae bacterium]
MLDQSEHPPGLYDEAIFRIEAEAADLQECDRCIVCHGTSARPYLRTAGGWTIVVCSTCGLGWMHPSPASDDIRGFYPTTYYGNTGAKFSPWIEWLVRVTAARRVRFLIRQLPPAARILDVGCGRGTLLSAFADRGFEACGFELSAEAAEFADPRARIQIGTELADAAYPAEHFDMVILWHVLEHLKHPDRTIMEIHRILKPGGRLILAVPNFSSWQAKWAGENWFHLDLPRHLFHFPLSGLRRMVEDRGFEYRSAHHFSLRQNPFGWIQSAMNRLTFLPRNALYSFLLRSREHRLSWPTRIALMSVFLLGMPVGLGLSVIAAVFRRGASVHVVWTRSVESHPSETPSPPQAQTGPLASSDARWESKPE